MNTPADLLPVVQEAMRLLDVCYVIRPMPRITYAAQAQAYYSPTAHEVVVPVDAPMETLAHELCHSQQPAAGGPSRYYRPDGSIDPVAWMRDEREIEAEAVAYTATAIVAGDTATVDLIRASVARGDALALWAMLAPAEKAAWLSHAWTSKPVLQVAGVVDPSPAWILWCIRADIRVQKPGPLARRARLALNAWARGNCPKCPCAPLAASA